jgi:hypothetical protein
MLRDAIGAAFPTRHATPHRTMLARFLQLAVWERDAKRISAMHGRRFDLLAPLVTQLNSAIYIVPHKELAIEAASAAQAQFDAKCARLEARLAAGEAGAALRPDVKAANDTADAAIRTYGHFLRCYTDARLAGAPIDHRNKPLESVHGATALDDGSAHAYLTAHLCIARLLSRRWPLDAREKLDDLKAAMARYSWLLENGARVSPPETEWGVTFMPDEAALCREMARLLPEQISQLHFRGVDVTVPPVPHAGARAAGAAAAAAAAPAASAASAAGGRRGPGSGSAAGRSAGAPVARKP